ILMGYDFYWQSVPKAGATDPLYTFSTSTYGDIASTLDSILTKQVPANKVLLGLPCYGYDWATQTNELNSATISTGKVIYYYNRNSYLDYTTLQQEQQSISPYYIFQLSSVWHQAFINSDYSIGERMDMANYRSLGGIGLWEISQL